MNFNLTQEVELCPHMVDMLHKVFHLGLSDGADESMREVLFIGATEALANHMELPKMDAARVVARALEILQNEHTAAHGEPDSIFNGEGGMHKGTAERQGINPLDYDSELNNGYEGPLRRAADNGKPRKFLSNDTERAAVLGMGKQPSGNSRKEAHDKAVALVTKKLEKLFKEMGIDAEIHHAGSMEMTGSDLSSMISGGRPDFSRIFGAGKDSSNEIAGSLRGLEELFGGAKRTAGSRDEQQAVAALRDLLAKMPGANNKH